MNKYVVTLLSALTLFTCVSAKAVIPLIDPLQAPQATLNMIQSSISSFQQQAKTILSYKTLAISGVSGISPWLKMDNLANLFESELESILNDRLNEAFGGEAFKKLVGDEIAGQFNINDLSGMNLDKLKELGLGELGDLSQDQLKELLGPDLAGKLTEDQIRALLNNPSGLVDFLSSAPSRTQKFAPANADVLNILAVKKDVFKKKSDSTASTGPNGNRSDAFGGTGNGSTSQSTASLDSFKEIQKNVVEKAQLPADPAAAKSLTSAQIGAVRQMQEAVDTDTAVTGLAVAWYRQTLMTRKMPEQEKEASKLVKEAKDERESIKAISYISLMGVEAQNNAANTFAEGLKTLSAQINKRAGSLNVIDPIAPVKSDTPPKKN